jgi:hypothetical protein
MFIGHAKAGESAEGIKAVLEIQPYQDDGGEG